MVSMTAAGDPAVCDGLLLLSYPLHPPGKPGQLRTAHLPALRMPAFFAHGGRDPFGSVEEMKNAVPLVGGKWRLHVVEKAGHELRGLAADMVVGEFLTFVSG